MRLLEAAQESIEHNGRVVYLKEPVDRRPSVPALTGLELEYAGGSHAGILSNQS